jgi:hypothetical protein
MVEPVDRTQQRRAAAAAESVPLAAAAMSDGGNLPGAPAEAAAPAVTVHGVEEGEEIEGRPDQAEATAEPAADDAAPAGRPADDSAADDSAADGTAADDRAAEGGDPPVATRPLGSAPLLDSEPLPATRPGMLRPRPASEGGFSLPVQRPAFDLGPDEEPADIV